MAIHSVVNVDAHQGTCKLTFNVDVKTHKNKHTCLHFQASLGDSRMQLLQVAFAVFFVLMQNAA